MVDSTQNCPVCHRVLKLGPSTESGSPHLDVHAFRDSLPKAVWQHHVLGGPAILSCQIKPHHHHHHHLEIWRYTTLLHSVSDSTQQLQLETHRPSSQPWALSALGTLPHNG